MTEQRIIRKTHPTHVWKEEEDLNKVLLKPILLQNNTTVYYEVSFRSGVPWHGFLNFFILMSSRFRETTFIIIIVPDSGKHLTFKRLLINTDFCGPRNWKVMKKYTAPLNCVRTGSRVYPENIVVLTFNEAIAIDARVFCTTEMLIKNSYG